MAKDPKPRDTALSRRNFLTVASVAAATGALAPTAQAGEPDPRADSDENELAYRETPHIKAFYHTSRF